MAKTSASGSVKAEGNAPHPLRSLIILGLVIFGLVILPVSWTVYGILDREIGSQESPVPKTPTVPTLEPPVAPVPQDSHSAHAGNLSAEVPREEKPYDPSSASYASDWLLPNIHSFISNLMLNMSLHSEKGTDDVSMEQLKASIASAGEERDGHKGDSAGFGATEVLDTMASERLGATLRERGLRPKHPVVIIPGFIASGLELWMGQSCANKRTRQRMWGTLSMMQAFITDPACWLKHVSLDPITGLDPEGIKLRPAQGLECIEYPMPGYWLFARVVEALVDLGYDPNSLISATYDWRLSLPDLEKRDGFFTRLRSSIEDLQHLHGEKVVIIGHSYGEIVYRAFLHWVEAGDPGWIDYHLEAAVNIGGPVLGIPKVMTGILSGELRETAPLTGLAGMIYNGVLPRKQRVKMFRTWGSLLTMSPIGGNKVWGNTRWAPDDTPSMREAGTTYGAQLTLTNQETSTGARGLGMEATGMIPTPDPEVEAEEIQDQWLIGTGSGTRIQDSVLRKSRTGGTGSGTRIQDSVLRKFGTSCLSALVAAPASRTVSWTGGITTDLTDIANSTAEIRDRWHYY
eukprot:gene13787-19696_t